MGHHCRWFPRVLLYFAHHRSDAIASGLVAVAIVGAIYKVYWLDGLFGVHDVNVHDYGTRLAISLHVEVAAGMDARDAHLIADEVERRIDGRLNADTVVHIDPPG